MVQQRSTGGEQGVPFTEKKMELLAFNIATAAVAVDNARQIAEGCSPTFGERVDTLREVSGVIFAGEWEIPPQVGSKQFLDLVLKQFDRVEIKELAAKCK